MNPSLSSEAEAGHDRTALFPARPRSACPGWLHDLAVFFYTLLPAKLKLAPAKHRPAPAKIRPARAKLLWSFSKTHRGLAAGRGGLGRGRLEPGQSCLCLGTGL